MNEVKNKSGLTTIASTLIIIGLVIAIGIVFIIIYNIISSEVEYYTESNISLQIEKSSVVIGDDNKVSLKVSRGAGDAELEKIKFVLFDGENIEEIEKKASELEESSEMGFSFTPKLVTNIKTISVVPIINVNGKRKYLAVANSIQITKKENNGTFIAETPTTTCGNAKQEAGEQCDDGNLFSGDGCSSSCKTEITTTTNLDCGNNVCNGTETCSTCEKDCGVCATTSACGNSVKDSGEECDLGSSKNTNTACATTYGMNCSYCSTSCRNITIAGSYCGDNTCNSPTETSVNCVGDCPLCTQGNTQPCGTTDVGECAFGTQTCSVQKTWGACTGEIVAVAENTGTTCSDAKDNDCDALIDCADTNCNGQTCATGKTCQSGSCATSAYTLSVSKSGSGTITSSPSGINCGSTCSYNFNSGASVTLTATPAPGNSFSGWGGACSGTGTCSVTMSSAKSADAVFVIVYTYSWFTPTEWSGCSVACGGGTQTKTAYCKRNDGVNMGSTCGAYQGCECPTPTPQSQSCNPQACPTCGALEQYYYFGGAGIADTRVSAGEGGPGAGECRNWCSSYPSTTKKSCWWYQSDGGCVLGNDVRIARPDVPVWYASNCA